MVHRLKLPIMAERKKRIPSPNFTQETENHDLSIKPASIAAISQLINPLTPIIKLLRAARRKELREEGKATSCAPVTTSCQCSYFTSCIDYVIVPAIVCCLCVWVWVFCLTIGFQGISTKSSCVAIDIEWSYAFHHERTWYHSEMC